MIILDGYNKIMEVCIIDDDLEGTIGIYKNPKDAYDFLISNNNQNGHSELSLRLRYIYSLSKKEEININDIQFVCSFEDENNRSLYLVLNGDDQKTFINQKYYYVCMVCRELL